MANDIKVGGGVTGSILTAGNNNNINEARLGGGARHLGADEMSTHNGGGGRRKAEKFGILDSPSLLKSDLEDLTKTAPVWGAAVLYLDIDHFKKVNSEFTERVVDSELLPAFQKLINIAVGGLGYAYAEGGDEVVILLPNHSPGRAELFANELLTLVSSEPFSVQGKSVPLTISVGVASSTQSRHFKALPDKANHGKALAKEKRNHVVTV
jgi:diguanylate cyclase (GGDEF)-like protein